MAPTEFRDVGKTRTGRIEMTADGIVIIRIFPNLKQTVEDAKENVAAAAAIGKGRKTAFLSDIREATPLDPETRHYYTGRQLTDYFLALGLLVRADAFGRMMGNIYLRIAKPGIPSKLFGDEMEALAWLRGFRDL